VLNIFWKYSGVEVTLLHCSIHVT